MTLGFNERNRGIITRSTNKEVLDYIEKRLVGKRTNSLQQVLGYGNIYLSKEILDELNPLQKEIILYVEPLINEVKYFYLNHS